jgi:hypothetical protein
VRRAKLKVKPGQRVVFRPAALTYQAPQPEDQTDLLSRFCSSEFSAAWADGVSPTAVLSPGLLDEIDQPTAIALLTRAQPERPRERLERAEVLLGEDFRRRHHHGLRARRDRVRTREHRDGGLAAADVALQEPQHAVAGGHVAEDVRDGFGLRICQVVGQGLDQSGAKLAGARQLAALRPLHVGANEREGQLVGQ